MFWRDNALAALRKSYPAWKSYYLLLHGHNSCLHSPDHVYLAQCVPRSHQKCVPLAPHLSLKSRSLSLPTGSLSLICSFSSYIYAYLSFDLAVLHLSLQSIRIVHLAPHLSLQSIRLVRLAPHLSLQFRSVSSSLTICPCCTCDMICPSFLSQECPLMPGMQSSAL